MSDIGKLEHDENGKPFRMINGKRIGQIDNHSYLANWVKPDWMVRRDEAVNNAINAHRASGNKTVDRRYNPNL